MNVRSPFALLTFTVVTPSTADAVVVAAPDAADVEEAEEPLPPYCANATGRRERRIVDVYILRAVLVCLDELFEKLVREFEEINAIRGHRKGTLYSSLSFSLACGVCTPRLEILRLPFDT